MRPDHNIGKGGNVERSVKMDIFETVFDRNIYLVVWTINF